MPEQFSQQPQQPNNPQNVEVIQPDTNLTPQAPNQQSAKSRGSVITFILLSVGAVIGFIVGGSVTSYLGQRGYFGDVGLAGIYYMLFPIPIFAWLSVFAYRGVRSLNKNYKIFGYTSLFIITFSLALSFLLLYLDYKERQAEIAAIPSKVDFQIYKPSSNHPFKHLHSSHNPIKEDIEFRCRGVEYTYYGNELGPSLVEMKADEYNCPEFEYINREKYDDALKAAKENTTFGRDSTAVSKKINGDTVLLVTEHSNERSWLGYIYSIKGNTLISIRVGGCVSGTECEDKYLEFYKSLEPISSD